MFSTMIGSYLLNMNLCQIIIVLKLQANLKLFNDRPFQTIFIKMDCSVCQSISHENDRRILLIILKDLVIEHFANFQNGIKF